jgi:hypothetical protein
LASEDFLAVSSLSKAPPVYKPSALGVNAPPVYKPQQPANSGVQLKSANHHRTETRPAPPAYQPQKNTKPQVQTKVNGFNQETRPAPPVYRPQQCIPQLQSTLQRTPVSKAVVQAPKSFPPGAAMHNVDSQIHRYTTGSTHAAFPRHASGAGFCYPVAIQRALSAAGTAYLEHVITDRTWGSQAEAHAIAVGRGFQTHIYENRAGTLRLLSTVGNPADPMRNLSLLWTGVHYKVLSGGAALDGQPYSPAQVAYDPTGDGNCMYEAMFYILRVGDARIVQSLQRDSERASHVRNMRLVAAQNLDPALANILGEELANEAEAQDYMPSFKVEWLSLGLAVAELYKAFPPKQYFLQYDQGKGDYFFHKRLDKSKGEALVAVLTKTLKIDKKEQAQIVKYAAKDRSYFSEEAAAKKSDESDVLEYPFPVIVPKLLYRWCSNAAAKDAVATGITKVGGVHDGIPTMVKLIKKDKAQGGGGVGIVSADRCLEIDTSAIPEIAGRKPNSINAVKAKGGTEYKILVSIPAKAIKDITQKTLK